MQKLNKSDSDRFCFQWKIVLSFPDPPPMTDPLATGAGPAVELCYHGANYCVTTQDTASRDKHVRNEVVLTVANVDTLRDKHGQGWHPFTAAAAAITGITLAGRGCRTEYVVPRSSPEAEVLSVESHLHLGKLEERTKRQSDS